MTCINGSIRKGGDPFGPVRPCGFINCFVIVNGLVKSRKCSVVGIPAKLVLDLIGERESSNYKRFWMPAAVYPALDAGQT